MASGISIARRTGSAMLVTRLPTVRDHESFVGSSGAGYGFESEFLEWWYLNVDEFLGAVTEAAGCRSGAASSSPTGRRLRRPRPSTRQSCLARSRPDEPL